MASPNKKNANAGAAPAANDGSVASVARVAVTVTGIDLVKLIAATGGAYLTQTEGKEIVDAGYATVNMSDVQGETALVTLTDGGRALLEAAATKGKPVFEIDDDVPMPEAPKKRGGKRGSKYPFENLEVGKSFHVPKTKDMPNPVSALASSLTGARRRFETPALDADQKPIVETVKVKTYATDNSGKRLKVNGKFVVSGESTAFKPKMIQQRDFTVVEVGADDKRGPGARVYRTK